MMHTVMGNEGTRGIKKQILLSLGLFFSFSQLSAMCPQTVGFITPTEGVWSLLSRIGIATNVIESQICALDACVCGTTGGSAAGNIDCSFTFGQTDIGAGSVYVISAPGTYCLTENASFTIGDAVTVSSNDVTIDMKGHTLNGGGFAAAGITLADGVQNVNIKNGVIEASIFGIRDTSGAVTPLQNITIQNMQFNANLAAIGISGASAGIFDVRGIVISDCIGYNSGGIIIRGSVGVIQRCYFEEHTGVGLRGITVFGISPASLAQDWVIQDCISTSDLQNQEAPIRILYSRGATIRNCLANGVNNSTGGAFAIENCQNVVVSDCSALNCPTAFGGFEVIAANTAEAGTLVMNNCVAQNCGPVGLPGSGCGFRIRAPGAAPTGGYNSIVLTNCVADNNNETGFQILNDRVGVVPFTGIYLKDCQASGNGTCGFILATAPGSAGVIEGALFEGCVAQFNNGNGFALANPTGALFIDVVFRNCVAQQQQASVNTFFGATFPLEGFGVASLPGSLAIFDVEFENCVAKWHASPGSVGFHFGPLAARCLITNCQAEFCTTGILLRGSDVNVRDCVVANSGNPGIDVFGSTINIRDCDLLSNGTGISLEGPSSQISIRGCNVHHSVGAGINVSGSSVNIVDCTASEGGTDGFTIGPSAVNCILRTSNAFSNGGTGINNLLGATAYLVNNITEANGINSAGAILSSVYLLSAAAGYWVNISG
jgi:hypothetical protein